MDFFRVGLVMEENGNTSVFDLDVKDAFTLLEYCMGKDEPELRARAIQMIQCFTKEALESKAFLDSSRATVEVIFALDELSVSEIFFFKAVINILKE
jgi:hypothetical protein